MSVRGGRFALSLPRGFVRIRQSTLRRWLTEENQRGRVLAKVTSCTSTNDILAGLKLVGFGVWERRSGGGRNVTFPARQYAVNGELRPIEHLAATVAVRDIIL